MPFDSQIRLRQLHNPEISGYIVEIVGKYLTTGSGVTVNTGILTGVFYPLKANPSGYLSSISTGGLVDYPTLATNNANLLAQIDLLYYPRSNPSGYGQGSGSGTSFNTGDFASIIDRFHNTGFDLYHPTQSKTSSLRFNQTGFYLDSFSAGIRRYIDIHNALLSGYDVRDVSIQARDLLSIKPSNGAALANYPFLYLDLGGKSVSFLIQSTQNTGLFYDVMLGRMNMSGISGWGITGTNAFALLDNRSATPATGFKYWQGKEYYQSGSGTKIDYYKKIISGFEISGYLSNSAFNSSSGYLDTKISNLKADITSLSGDAVLTGDLILWDEQGQQSVLWGYNTRQLLTNYGAPTIDWQNKQLISLDNQATIDWANYKLRTDDPPVDKLDWFNGVLSGDWIIKGSLSLSDLLVSGQSVLTGSMTQFLSKASGDALYYPTGNPNNYVTASYVSQFATKTDAVSRTNLSQNTSVHLADTYGVTNYNNLGFKQKEFFYLKGPSGKNVIDFYLNTLTGFSGNFTTLKLNGTPVSTMSSNDFVKQGAVTQNKNVLFNGTSQVVMGFDDADYFYLRDNSGNYLIDIYSGEILGFDITASRKLSYLDAGLQDYSFFISDDSAYFVSPNGGNGFIDLTPGNEEIDGFSINAPIITVNGLNVVTQILNTGEGSGIYDSTDGQGTVFLKTLIGGNGINISGSGKTLILSVTGITGGAGSTGTVNTGQLTGAFYPLTGNPSGFVTSSQTGQLTGTFYPRFQNPSGYLNAITAGGLYIAKSVNASQNNLLGLVYGDQATLGFYYVGTGTGSNTSFYLKNFSGNHTIDIVTGVISGFDISGKGLRLNYSLGGPDQFVFNDQEFYLTNIPQDTYIDIAGKEIEGFFINAPFISQNFVQVATMLDIQALSGWTGTTTGLFYPLNSNPSGYVRSTQTGNFVTASQTGNFVTTSQTGSFGSQSSGNFPFFVQHAKLPTGNAARIDAGETNWRLLYASGVSQSALWQCILPSAYTTGLQVRLHFTMNMQQAGTKTVVWNVYSLNSEPNNDSADINTKPFVMNSGVHSLANNQLSGLVREQVIVLSAYTGAANHFSMFRVERSGVADTASGDAELIGFCLEYR
jgi:hypothetical protein